MRIPNFKIDTSGLTDSIESLERQFNETSRRLSEGAEATVRDLETERGLRRGAAIRGFAGRAILGGVAIGSDLSKMNNQKAINARVTEAQTEYEQALFNFQGMNSKQQADYLNSGAFEKINDKLLDFLDEDWYGVDTEGIKQRWSAQFRSNYNKVQLQVLKTTREENKATIGKNRAEFRNKVIANPYHPDATNGTYAMQFRNSINGIVDSIEEADEYQLYDQIYGMLHGLYNFGDYQNMERILNTDEAKRVLGDDYNKLVKQKNSLKDAAEKAGNTNNLKVTNIEGSFSRLGEDIDIASFEATMEYEGLGGLGRGFIDKLREYVSTADPREPATIDVSSLHRYIPRTANPTQQAKDT